MTTEDKATFEGFCVLELLGHRKLGGYVSQEEMFGTAFCRIDVPAVGEYPATTQFYSPSSIYCMTPTTEAIATAVAARYRPEPVSRFELPAPEKLADAPVLRNKYEIIEADRGEPDDGDDDSRDMAF